MSNGRGFKAVYDYVEIVVEPKDGQWRLVLNDTRHVECAEYDELFPTAEEARDAALSAAQHHINIQHNDTLLAGNILSWSEL